MVDIVERARSPEFADVAAKYLLAECAAEIERLRAALDTTQASMTANYDAGGRAAAAEIEKLRAEVVEAKAGHAHLMGAYQALGRECYEKLGAAERAGMEQAKCPAFPNQCYRAGMERAAEIAHLHGWHTCDQQIRAELARPARKEE